MNKAAFLNIIRQIAPIQDQEVEDLEELVASFPYCQTAHILLAKAAYERGSMLSTQKLRRAAAHASNRQLLKRIVYAPPILHDTAGHEILEEEENQPVFDSISGNEAKNGFPEVAPEVGILQALEDLTEEDLLETEVGYPYDLEETKVTGTYVQSLEEFTTVEQANSQVEEPSQGIEEEVTAPEIEIEEVVSEDENQVYIDDIATAEASFTLSQVPLEETEPAFMEDLILEETLTPNEASASDIVDNINEEIETAVLLPEWQKESEFEQTLVVENEFADDEKSEAVHLPAYAIDENDGPILLNTQDLLLENEQASTSEGSIHAISSQENEESVFEAEIEADFITNAVQELTSNPSATKNHTGENKLDLSTKEESLLDSKLVNESAPINEIIEGENFQDLTLAKLSSDRPINIESEEVIFSEEENETVTTNGLETDELYSLMQIDSLSTLSAPIPSVNLTHAEIISELTSRPEPIEYAAEESVIQEETIELAISQEEPTIDSELVAFMDGLEGPGEKDSVPSAADDLSAFPMLQMPSMPSGTLEVETAKDPYLSIFYHNSLAYWMDSSRLGETIQLRDDLTTSKPYYFQPDLILEHVKGNGALEQLIKPVAKLDVQLTIIDQFLKSNPKLKSMAHSQQKSEPQEDLSAKSSKIKKNLASENLAFIFIKQGKYKKALKIYEQLIVKFPEKKSYFAEQIEKLRNEL